MAAMQWEHLHVLLWQLKLHNTVRYTTLLSLYRKQELIQAKYAMLGLY